MADEREEKFINQDGLSALQYWLLDFPQLQDFRDQQQNDNDDITNNNDFGNNINVVTKIIEIAEEICDCKITTPSSAATPITSPGEAWAAIHSLISENDLITIDDIDDDEDITTKECQYKILCALLCHALSDKCEKQHEYVGRIMAMGTRPDVQQEIMRIIQENSSSNNNNNGGGSSSDVEESNNETGDYSAFMEASAAASLSETFEYESDVEEMKRDRSEAFGNTTAGSNHSDSPKGKRFRHADDEGNDETFEGDIGGEPSSSVITQHKSMGGGEEDDLRATIAKLQLELKESRQNEINLTVKVDEDQSNHRAEMLQVESKYMKSMRDIEDRYTNEISEQKRELDNLRDYEQRAKELKEENSRLRDDLDVLECSKEKLSYTEDQLRKCRDRIELIGDAHDALQREEKAHAASVDKCLSLENELALLKPLKRQLEEYKLRATNAEVALAECREDLRRIKEKSSGLEGANRALKRGVDLHQAEAGNMQKQLQEVGGKSGKEGTAIGIGMSELNPELMEELKTLRSEYARLKEFESKREVDSVQRLEENCDDAKRLSERFKEQLFQTKSELEDTQQLLRESEAREAKLKVEIDDLTKKNKGLENEMKEERLKHHKAALDAERTFQNEKKSLIDKGRESLQELEDKLTLKIESEREQHKAKMDRVEAQRVEIENNLQLQLTTLRDSSSKILRTTKEQAQKDMDELEQNKQAEVEKVLKDKADEIEALTTRGKNMIRESKRKAKELQRQITEEYEVKISSLEEELDKVKSIQEEYEEKATTKITKRDHQIQFLQSKDGEKSRTISELEDKVRKAERKSKDLAGDNDRLRRQLGSRSGQGGASQEQLDDLTSVCKSLQEENRRLKEMNPDRFLLARDAPEPSPGSDIKGTTSFSKSTLTELRQEYEEKIEMLEEEKRESVMKSAAAVNETSKAEQRAWELGEELNKVKSELTTAKLALQRNERRTDFSAGLSSSSQKHYERGDHGAKENAENEVHHRLPPSGAKTRQDFTPKFAESSPHQKKEAVPSIMDHLNTKNDADTVGGTPECQQS